ncbi:MAG: hypothetical protein ACRYFZ_08455 [Janthinobacterium lividum]
MTADQRLDQLELLVSEALTVLDRHTAQLKQLTSAVTNVTTLLVQQSDSISFLLREHIVIKDDVATLKADVSTLKTDVATLKTDVAMIKTDVTEMRAEFGSKLDLILAKLN